MAFGRGGLSYRDPTDPPVVPSVSSFFKVAHGWWNLDRDLAQDFLVIGNSEEDGSGNDA